MRKICTNGSRNSRECFFWSHEKSTARNARRQSHRVKNSCESRRFRNLGFPEYPTPEQNRAQESCFSRRNRRKIHPHPANLSPVRDRCRDGRRMCRANCDPISPTSIRMSSPLEDRITEKRPHPRSEGKIHPNPSADSWARTRRDRSPK